MKTEHKRAMGRVNEKPSIPGPKEETKRTIYYFLERPESNMAIFYHLINLFVILGSIFISILSTVELHEENESVKKLALYVEILLLLWITAEYVIRVWSCSFLRKYRGFFGKIRFTRSLYMMNDAFVIVSTLVTVILSVKTAYFNIVRITKFLQIFRILRLDRQRGDLRTMAKVVYKHRKELISCYFVGFILLFGCTYLIYIIEKSSAHNSTIDNMANALYWAMITVTSVGYGDISPETWAGKLLTGVFALVGCAFFALPAGILGSGFALHVAKQKKQKRHIKVRNPAAIVIQNCWRNHAVMSHTRQLEGTWFYFFPQINGRLNNPGYYDLLPGLQEIMSTDQFSQMMNNILNRRPSRRFSTPFLKKSYECIEKEVMLEEEERLFRHKTNKSGHHFKKNHLEMALSTLLNNQYKEAIRFILRVKLFHSVKIFKNVRYPFVNVQDIMEKNSMCHIETLAYLKQIQRSFEEFRRELKDIRMLIKENKLLQKTLTSDDSDDDDEILAENLCTDVNNNYTGKKNTSRITIRQTANPIIIRMVK